VTRKPVAFALLPGESVYLVRDLSAFSERYDTSGITIAGEYSGRLSNGGERIVVVDGSTTVRDFSYDDAWRPATDGWGYPLEIVDPTAPTAWWSAASQWRTGARVHGSLTLQADAPPPPVTLGLQLPADLDQDGALTVVDAIGLLDQLFGGDPASLPCGADLASPGCRILLDVNGDLAVNLTDAVHLLVHVLAAGPPPALGTECVPIVDCPDACP